MADILDEKSNGYAEGVAKARILISRGDDMKKINKQESPQWFEDWKKNFKMENNREPHYKNDFSTDDIDGVNRRRKLRECLVDEQGKYVAIV